MSISLLGLPGAGKTTIATLLAGRLGMKHVALGELLRGRAENDAALREMLARGQLAPEPLVESILRKVASGDAVLDGFPRHAEQLALAQELFPRLRFVLLDVPSSVAISRVSGRVPVAKRMEDATDDVMLGRLRLAERDLAGLCAALAPQSLMRVDATSSAESVASEILRNLPQQQLPRSPHGETRCPAQ